MDTGIKIKRAEREREREKESCSTQLHDKQVTQDLSGGSK